MDITVFKMMRTLIDEYKRNCQWGTAHIYNSAYKAFIDYREGCDLAFRELSADVIKGFEIYIRGKQCSRNTAATYIKVVKATYNRAVEYGVAVFTPRLFANVRTSVVNRRKRALNAREIGSLMVDATARPVVGDIKLHQAKLVFRLMFLLRGIPFVDLAYLRKEDLDGVFLSYRRRKTGRMITVKITNEAFSIMKRLAKDTPRYSPYLFPFISSPEGTERAYREYQCALRQINRNLNQLSQRSAMRLSTYTARHTWATMAYHCEIHHGIISQAMGHSSIAVTETYLKPFHEDRIDEANEKVIEYVKQSAPLKR